jgi:hypothetical protein
MYKIVGSDGKEYGPVDAQQIMRWLAEGRVNVRSMVLAEGATEWKPLADFPELAGSGPVTQSQSSTPSPQSAGTRPLVSAVDAADRVKGPAIGLIVTAVLGFGLQALSLLFNVFGLSTGFGGSSTETAFNVFSGTFGIVLNAVGIAIGVVILLGALKMKRLENWGWAMASSILALAPCISPCCIVGLPIGIWSLVVLAKPEVKGAFR